MYLKYSCTKKDAKNVQKRVKTCKNVHLKYSLLKKTCKNVQNRAKTCISNIFGPNSKRAPARSVQLEAVYLEALLYPILIHTPQPNSC